MKEIPIIRFAQFGVAFLAIGLSGCASALPTVLTTYRGLGGDDLSVKGVDEPRPSTHHFMVDTSQIFGDKRSEFAVLEDKLPAGAGRYIRTGEWPRALARLDPMLLDGSHDAAWFAAGVCHEKMADEIFVFIEGHKSPPQRVLSRSHSNIEAVIQELTTAHQCYKKAELQLPNTRYRASTRRASEKLNFVLERRRVDLSP